jgi:hypothetical protein
MTLYCDNAEDRPVMHWIWDTQRAIAEEAEKAGLTVVDYDHEDESFDLVLYFDTSEDLEQFLCLVHFPNFPYSDDWEKFEDPYQLIVSRGDLAPVLSRLQEFNAIES